MTIGISFTQDLEFRRIDQLMRQNVTAPALIFICTAIFLAVGWSRIPHWMLIVLATVWLGSGILRFLITARWGKQRSKGFIYSPEELRRWHWFLIAGCLVSSLCLGAVGSFSRLYLGPDERLYFGLLIVGVCSGSIAVYALSLASSLAILLPAILIWCATLILTHTDWPEPTLLLLYLLAHIRFAKNWNTYAMNSLKTNLDLHESQEKLRLAMDSSGAASWAWDPQKDIFLADSNIEHVLGAPASDFYKLHDYLNKVHKEDREAVMRAFHSALLSGSIDLEHRLVPSTKLQQHVALRGKVQGGRGTQRTLAGITWDITNRKCEEALRFERDLFEKANQTKLLFLANVSHEIRTPLTAINGFSENILADPDLPHRFRESLGVVLRSGKYLTSVVHDLLDLSKAEADTIFIQKSKVFLAEEINDSIHAVHAAIENKMLKLNVIYDSPVPEVIISDATRLRQILTNLLSNSVKYTERGHIDIRVAFEERQNSGRLRIIVSDTGIGISQQDMRNLFQPFSRGESIQVRQRHGSGLGLVLSRTLALRMGGDLRLLSTVPQTETCEGSTAFELTIEVGACQSVPRITEHPWKGSIVLRPPSAGARSFENRHFLVVEDDEDIRWLLQDYLEKKGARVVSRQNGSEALQVAFDSHFDAVLMDIKMPVMDGYQATSLLRQKGFRHPIVALTAHANSSDMLMCYQAGCDFYLSKPIDFSHLEDVLKRCIWWERQYLNPSFAPPKMPTP